MKKLLQCLGWLLLAVVLVVVGYVAYVMLSYHRIEDKQTLQADIVSTEVLPAGESCTILTANIGYGSYPPSYSFFMDGGTESRAYSRDNVLANMQGIGESIETQTSDILLLQEVDEKANRSWKVDEYALLRSRFSSMNALYAVNYDSAYLFYPLTCPIGKTLSGLAVFSRYSLQSSLRRSLPIATDFSKLIDLDRCYTVSEIPVSNGKTLYLYNVHLTAYGSTAAISSAQITMLAEDMKAKTAAGNYVICGGDFNHDFTGTSVEQLNPSGISYEWCQPLPTSLLPEGITPCTDYTGSLVATCRNLDKPYTPGESFTVVLDGFLVSSNVECVTVENLDWGFTYSDHNPVRMVFRLTDAE